MIQRGANGVTLSRVKSDGTLESHNPIEGDAYYEFEEILEAQTQSAVTNQQVKDSYLGKLKLFQNDLDASRLAVGETAPAVPHMVIVDDYGLEHPAEFNPALPLPVYPVLNPTNVGLAPAATPEPDRLDLVIANQNRAWKALTVIANKFGITI